MRRPDFRMRLAAAVLWCAWAGAWAGAEPAARPLTPPSVAPTTQPDTQPADSSNFMRFVDDGAGGGKLLTAIVTYKNDAGVTLHLIGAVHVAEKEYYESLNKTFRGYDALLYEMVKPKGSPAPRRGQKSHSTIGAFQRFLKDVLSLDFQLDDIDYTRPNFVHADLDAETFSELQDERGESFLGLMLKSMLHEINRQAEGRGRSVAPITMIDLLVAIRAPDRPRQLKLLLAQQFGDIEEQMAGLDGPNGSVIITERNKKCIETLKTAIADGNKDIGIFYGAAHMKDMSQRVEKLGFHKVDSEWRVGWDMTAPTPATAPATQPALGPSF